MNDNGPTLAELLDHAVEPTAIIAIKDLIEIHQAMFRKLIDPFDQSSNRHLAALFEDVANKYLDIAEFLSGLERDRLASEIE